MDVTLDSIRDIRLYQSKKGYRFSVDALLLFDFVNLRKAGEIADLGAGSGIVGILLAKKYPDAIVTLFEIQEGLVALAQENIVLNNLEKRIKVRKIDIRRIQHAHESFISPHTFDLLVSNPPFRKLKSGRISEGEEKAVARHEIKMKLHDFVDAASYLLKTRGRLCMVYHPSRLLELLDILKSKNLEPKRLRFVHSNISSEAKMILVEATKGGRAGLKVDKPFYIYKADGSYTDEVRQIYSS